MRGAWEGLGRGADLAEKTGNLASRGQEASSKADGRAERTVARTGSDSEVPSAAELPLNRAACSRERGATVHSGG